MASATVVTVGGITGNDPVLMVYGPDVKRRRQVSPEAEMALMTIGRAIDYLGGNGIYEGNSFKLTDPRVQAVMLLLDKNREIYMSCPEVPTLGDRLRSWLHKRAA